MKLSMGGPQSERKSEPAQDQFISNPESLVVKEDGRRMCGWRRKKETPSLVSWKPREDLVSGRKSLVVHFSGRLGPRGAGS